MKRLVRTIPVLMLLVLLTAGTVVAIGAGEEQEPAPAVSKAYLHSYNLPSTGLALEGYCPVSYFVVNKPVRGKPEYASTYNDVTYQFASDEAKRAFDRNPEKFLPAYGGWCAFGMAIEDKFPIDPTAFKIVDGRLMVFLRNKNIDALALWNQNGEKAQVAKADAFWKKISQ